MIKRNLIFCVNLNSDGNLSRIENILFLNGIDLDKTKTLSFGAEETKKLLCSDVTTVDTDKALSKVKRKKATEQDIRSALGDSFKGEVIPAINEVLLANGDVSIFLDGLLLVPVLSSFLHQKDFKKHLKSLKKGKLFVFSLSFVARAGSWEYEKKSFFKMT